MLRCRRSWAPFNSQSARDSATRSMKVETRLRLKLCDIIDTFLSALSAGARLICHGCYRNVPFHSCAKSRDTYFFTCATLEPSVRCLFVHEAREYHLEPFSRSIKTEIYCSFESSESILSLYSNSAAKTTHTVHSIDWITSALNFKFIFIAEITLLCILILSFFTVNPLDFTVICAKILSFSEHSTADFRLVP